MNKKPSVEIFLKNTWEQIPTPPATEFRSLLNHVTKSPAERINKYGEAYQSPFYSMHWKSLSFGVITIGVVAVLALVILPNQSPFAPSAKPSTLTYSELPGTAQQNAQKYALAIPESSSNPVDAIIRDIYIDAILEAETADTETYEDVDISPLLDEFNYE
jgi:hypothetical protein